MFNFLYQIPDTYLFFILSFSTVIISVTAIHYTRKYIPFDLRYRDNPMLANMSSLISIIYGVLVGLTALYLITNISTTSEAVVREANAAADFYRDTRWLQEPARTNVQQLIKSYVEKVINEEWPKMVAGVAVDHVNDDIVDKITDELQQYKVNDYADLLVLRDMLSDVKALYDARELRIQMSYSELNPAIWSVILVGTILMIGICYLYSMNYYLHIITTSAISIMASAMIYLLISLDRPFQGEFIIESDVMKSVLLQINNSKNPPVNKTNLVNPA